MIGYDKLCLKGVVYEKYKIWTVVFRANGDHVTME